MIRTNAAIVLQMLRNSFLTATTTVVGILQICEKACSKTLLSGQTKRSQRIGTLTEKTILEIGLRRM